MGTSKSASQSSIWDSSEKSKSTGQHTAKTGKSSSQTSKSTSHKSHSTGVATHSSSRSKRQLYPHSKEHHDVRWAGNPFHAAAAAAATCDKPPRQVGTMRRTASNAVIIMESPDLVLGNSKMNLASHLNLLF